MDNLTQAALGLVPLTSAQFQVHPHLRAHVTVCSSTIKAPLPGAQRNGAPAVPGGRRGSRHSHAWACRCWHGACWPGKQSTWWVVRLRFRVSSEAMHLLHQPAGRAGRMWS